MIIFRQSRNIFYLFLIFCSLFISNVDDTVKYYSLEKLDNSLVEKQDQKQLKKLPPPTSGQLLIDIKTNDFTPSADGKITYKVRYRYASTTEHGTNAQIQLTFPDAYELVSRPLLGGNISSVSDNGNQYTISLESPSSLGLPSGTLAAGSSGLFEFKMKFQCGVNGVGDIPTAGTTVNLTQNPVFTVTGVTNTASSPSAVTTPTVNACDPAPTSSTNSSLIKQAHRSVVGQGMYDYWNMNVPTTTSAVTFTDNFPSGFKLYDGLYTTTNFPSNWVIEIEANGSWWDITTFNQVDLWIKSVSNGAALKDKNGTTITGTSRVDVDYPYSTPDISYAENVTGIRFTSPVGGDNGKNFKVYTYVPLSTPIGWYQNCLSSSNAAWTASCRDIYVTDRGSLGLGCYFQYGSEGLGGSDLSTSNGGYLTTNYPSLYKDPADLQGTLNIEQYIKTTSVEDITAQVLLPEGFDFVEGTATPNYWVVEDHELSTFNSVAALTPTFSRTLDYNGTGRVLIKWEFPNLVFPEWAPHSISDFKTRLRIYYSIRYMGTVALPTSGNIVAYPAINTGTVMVYTYGGANYTGTPTQDLGCSSYFGVTGISGDVNSEKYVQGSLDVQQSRYPIVGNTDLDGNATYELYVYNHNKQSLKQIDVADILPYIGDKEMLGTTSRGSSWSEEIASNITVERYKIGSGEISALGSIPDGILYSNTYNACYLDGALPTGQVTASPASASVGQSAGCTDFSSSVAATGAKGFGFRWSNSGDPLTFGEYLKITIPVQQLGGEADMTNNEVAWNSFAYTAVESDDDVLFSSEPLKVGVKMIDMSSVSNICGRVWQDENANGRQDLGEPSVEGITVSLYDNTGNPVTQTLTINGITSTINVTALTDTLGNYCFYGLAPSTNYYVRLENENNFTTSGALSSLELTTPNASGVLDEEDSDASEGTLSGSPAIARPQIFVSTGVAGTTIDNNDFGFYGFASIGNYAWYDDDAEGDQDNTENPASGVTMSLYKVGGFFVESQITDADGRYLFTNQIPGQYYIVASTIPVGKIPTGKNITGNDENDSDFSANSSFQTDVISLSSGDNIGSIDLGLKDEVTNPAAICGNTWDDLDEDGVIDGSEPAQPRVTINLLDASGFVVSTTISDETGDYCFNNLEPNITYQLVFLLPSVNGSSYTNSGSNMEANSTTGVSLITYTPTNNQTINNVDCGFIGPFSIGNLVWSDVNDNGIKDASESAISNVTISLLNSTGSTTLATTTTDAYGKYVFTGLTAGSYKVQLTLPNNMKSATDIGSSSSPNSADDDDNGLGVATSGNVVSDVIVLEQGGGSNSGANWFENDHGEIINRTYDPASNPKAYYTMDFGLRSFVVEICNNGIDDDGDGLIDCADPDCYLVANTGGMDADGDGYDDNCDEDDDNDGILDIVECPTPATSGSSAAITTFNAYITSTDLTDRNLPHVLDSILVNGTTYTDFIVPDGYTSNLTLSNTSTVAMKENATSKVFTYTNPNWDQDILAAFQSRNLNKYQQLDANNFSDGDFYILNYNTPLVSTDGGFIAMTERKGNNEIKVEGLDENGVSYGLIITGQPSGNYVDLGANIHYSGNENAFMALFPIEALAPIGSEIHSIKISFGSSAGSDGPDGKVFFFGNLSAIACDYDGDGIPNNLDLDSDNDGCPDALEGGASFTHTNLSSDRLTGGVDANGIPTVATASGQTVGSSQAENVSACIEICNDGIDNDGDGFTDCLDSDCGIVTIDNAVISACIDQPYADVAKLDVTVSWSTTTTDTIEVTIVGKTEHIDVGSSTSPVTVSFMVPADGSANNSITAKFKGKICESATTYTAPAACSNDQLSCSVLYLCGDSKGVDADAFDHGLLDYIDGINGNAVLTPALTKNEAGMGLYDPMNTSTALSITLTDYDIIFISSTTWGYLSSDLINDLKDSEVSILILMHEYIDDLGMVSSNWYATQEHAYSDNTTQVQLYNFNNTKPHWSPLVGVGNYFSATADAYLWRGANNQSSNTQGVFFHYTASDNLTGVAATHGSRTYLGYYMDGVYWNDDTNQGASPVPQAEWFDPIRHLTQEGKFYLDQALILASQDCTVEDCTDNIDNDGDGLIDCADPDCEPSISNVAITQPTCANKTGGQIVITATGSGVLTYSINNSPSYQVSNTFNNLGVGQYIIRVKNDSGCETEYTSNPIILDMPTCIEICNDGIDNDGNGLIDCDDPCCDGVGNATGINNN